MPPPINSPTVDSNPQQGGGLLSGIVSGLPLVGGVLNGITQMFTNASNRKFQLSMYNRERADALSDWNMQNAYNSPSAQMERLKSAGLNPNLVYGNGANALEASPVRQSSPGGNNQQAPNFNLSGALPLLFTSLNQQIKEMQIEQMKTNVALQQSRTTGQDITNTQILPQQAEGLNLSNQLKGVQLYIQDALENTNVAYGQEKLRNLNAQIYSTLSSVDRNNVLASATVDQAVGKISLMAQQALTEESKRIRMEVQNAQSIQETKNLLDQDKIIQKNWLNTDLRNKLMEQNVNMQELNVQWKASGISDRDNIMYRLAAVHGKDQFSYSYPVQP